MTKSKFACQFIDNYKEQKGSKQEGALNIVVKALLLERQLLYFSLNVLHLSDSSILRVAIFLISRRWNT